MDDRQIESPATVRLVEALPRLEAFEELFILSVVRPLQVPEGCAVQGNCHQAVVLLEYIAVLVMQPPSQMLVMYDMNFKINGI